MKFCIDQSIIHNAIRQSFHPFYLNNRFIGYRSGLNKLRKRKNKYLILMHIILQTNLTALVVYNTEIFCQRRE